MNSADFVLDASAILAALDHEPGSARVEAALGRAVVGAVNLSEVVAKYQERGLDDAAADTLLAGLNLTVIPFDEGLAIAAGRLRRDTRHRGLSFGDRACLSLGAHLGATVLTADRVWADLDLGMTIEVIR